MIPGKVVGISHNGERKFQISGLRNEDQPMELETAFDIGSVTKIVSTTSIIMKMVYEEVLNLDTRVCEILPQWSSEEKSKITITDLLEHQSGLNEWKPLYINHATKEAALGDIAESPLKYPIGTGRHYSDLGFITLGQIIEVAKKRPIDAIFQSEIAEPLKLTQTRYVSPANLSNVAATSLGDRIEKEMVDTQKPYPVDVSSAEFAGWRDHRLAGEINDGNAFHIFNSVSGHAGLFSTVGDLLTFGEHLLAGQGFFHPENVQLFTSARRDPMQGLGFRNWRAGKYIGHTGFPGVAIAIDLHEKSVIALMTNRISVDGTPTPTDQLLSEYFS